MSNKSIGFEKNEKKGLIFAFFAAFSYATMAAIVKLATEVPPPVTVFFRNLICFILLSPVFLKGKNFKTKRIGLFTLRIFFGFITLNCFYFAAKHLYLVDAVLLINTSPLFIPIVILIWDRVRIPKMRILAICIGFIGILFILKPRFDFFNFAGMIGLISGISIACALVSLKKLSKTEPIERLLFYFFTGNLILGFFPMVFSLKKFKNPIMWFYILLVGIAAFIYQFLITKAYSYSHPTKVGPIAYFAIVVSAVYGWLFWGNLPDIRSITGTVLVIAGGIIVLKDKKPVQSLT